MKRCLTLFGCSLLFLCTTVVAEGDVDESAQATQDEPLAQNEPAVTDVQAQPLLTPSEQIAKLELPENPTRAQCEAFIAELRVLVSKSGRSDGPNDTVILKLNSIPVEHISLLTVIVENGIAPQHFRNYEYFNFTRHAIKLHDPESYRKIAIDGLAEDPSLILLIVENGWYQAAKDTIVATLENTNPFIDLPIYWFQAFVEVAEPEHHELLHRMALNFTVRNGGVVTQKLSLLERLEGYDFARTVDACWNNLTPELGNGRNSSLRQVLSTSGA